MTRLGIALIGCGRIAGNHAWAAREAGFELRWACDLEASKAKEFAARFTIPHVAADVREIEQDKLVDAVVVATDHASHIELARQFVSTRAVMIEKPLGISRPAVEEFVRLVTSTRSIVGVVSQHRYRPHVKAIRSALQHGAFGSVELVRIKTIAGRPDTYYSDGWHGRRDREGGSALINQCYHAIDLAIDLFGDPTIISARAWRHRPLFIEVDEGFVGQMTFPGQIEGQLYASVVGSVEWDCVLEIYGTRGHAVFDLNYPGKIREWSCARSVDVTLEDEPPPGTSYYGCSHRDVLMDFHESIVRRRSPSVTVESAARTFFAIEAFYAKSIENSPG